jgi:hypothetical protein
MKRKKPRGSTPKLTPEQIDRQVAADADVDSAWQRAIIVRRPKSTSLSIPAELAARATFLARLHRERKVDKWVERIVRERLRPGQPSALKARVDGTVLEGHHRLAVLRERGVDIDTLPRELVGQESES